MAKVKGRSVPEISLKGNPNLMTGETEAPRFVTHKGDEYRLIVFTRKGERPSPKKASIRTLQGFFQGGKENKNEGLLARVKGAGGTEGWAAYGRKPGRSSGFGGLMSGF